MNKQKTYCKNCALHWTHGAKDGKHDNWCCAIGQPAAKAIGHCKNTDQRKLIRGKIDG